MSFIGISTNIWKDIGGTGGGGASWVLAPGGVVATLDIDFVNNRAWNNGLTTIPTLLTCTRATPANASYMTSGGTILYFAANTLRYGNNGLLVEEARSNRFQGSENFGNASAGWGNNRCNATINLATAPDGNFTANRVTVTVGNAPIIERSLPGTATYVMSLFSKFIDAPFVGFFIGFGGVENSIAWQISIGASAVSTTTSFTNSGMDILANGWYRIWVSFNSENIAAQNMAFSLGDNALFGDATAVGQQSYFWGFSVENGTFPTSYIPNLNTGAVSVTRAVDVVQFSNTSWIGAAANSLYAQFVNPVATGAFNNISFLSDGTNNNSMAPYVSNGGQYRTFSTSGGSGDGDAITANSTTAGVTQKAATALDTNDLTVILNGGTPVQDATVTRPIGLNFCRLGVANNITDNPFNGYIKRFAAWQSRLSNASLQLVTT